MRIVGRYHARMKREHLAALAGLLLTALPVSAGDPIVTTDVLRIRSASSIDVAADGSTAVVAVRSVAPIDSGDTGSARGASREDAGDSDGHHDGKGEPDPGRFVNQSHLYLLRLNDAGAVPRRLTRGNRFDHSPRLSPDGRLMAFVRGRGAGDNDSGNDGESAQVWVMPVDGGEAWPVTDLEHGAGSPRWAPGGRRLLVSSAVEMGDLSGVPAWGSERPSRPWPVEDAASPDDGRPDGSRVEVIEWLENNARDLDPYVISRLEFQGEQSLRGQMRFTHLFLVDASDQSGRDDPRFESTRITHGFYDYRDAMFMPDGRSVLCVSKRPAPDAAGVAHPDRIRATGIWQTPVDGTESRLLVFSEEWSMRSPQPGADGSVVAFVGRRLDEPTFRPSQLGMVSLTADGASEPVWLTEPETFDRSVRSVSWMPARSALVFNTTSMGGFPLMTTGIGLLEPAVIIDEQDGAPVGVNAFGVGGGTIVYSVTSAANPCAIRVRDARGDRLLFDLNTWLAGKDLATPVGGWITRPDGTRVQYWLMEPTDRRAGEKYPLVAEIHGGPSAMWGPGEFTMWHEFQLLCSWGYGVVYANPRGSGGYGYAFQKGNYQNWGDGPAGDVLAAVDQVVLEEWVDQDRLVVTGGSYGGYLTAWIVGHDHRFKAAVAQRGVYDLTTFFGEGNAWRLVRWSMGGYPWDARIRPILQRESPFTSVNRIRTPLLIMHGSRDLRTGVSQSEMLYRALKELGRDVEYVRYPNTGHELSRSGEPHQRMDRLNRIVEFFDRHVQNDRPAPRVRGRAR